MVIDVLKDYESAREVIASALDESIFSRRGVAKLLNVPASTLSHNISGSHGKYSLVTL